MGRKDSREEEISKIKGFWDNKAHLSLKVGTVTLGDKRLRQLEINAIAKYLVGQTRVLDVGCGDGFSTLEWARRYPSIEIHGIDYSERMIDLALESLANEPLLSDRVKFGVEDILSPKVAGTFNCIVTERCLQNLPSWDLQKQAIINIADLLVDNGLFVMLECSITSLDRLIRLAKRLGKPGPEGYLPWHNLFFSDQLLLSDPDVAKRFIFERIDNFASIYTLLNFTVPRLLPLSNLFPSIGSFGHHKIFLWRKRMIPR